MLITQRAAMALAVLLAASAATGQPVTKNPVPEEYSGTTVNLAPGSNIPLSIQVLTWSSKADRTRVVSIIRPRSNDTKLPDLVKELAEVPTIGYIWTDDALGYSIKYAYRTTQPDRSERVVIVTDRPLGTWGRAGRWKGTGKDGDAGPFTIVELHVNKQGKGDGKMSVGASFTVDDADQAISLSDYEHAAVMLKDVTHKATSHSAGES